MGLVKFMVLNRKGVLLSKLEVVTTIKGKPNPVKIFSEKENLGLHKWPPDFAHGQFDVGLVVGMINVHASLLPRWRGAAPIIYALASGDTQTGITIMKISPKKFDVGEIVSQESIQIHPDMKMGRLFTQLGTLGAANLIKTVASLPQNLSNAQPQPADGVTYAPKVKPEFANIKWDAMTARQIYDLERALDGVFHLQTMWKDTPVKLISVSQGEFSSTVYDKFNPGFVVYDKQKKILKILCSNSQFIIVEKVGVVGKKIMTATDFNNGYVKKEPPD
ncbi:methionyl-tRNA formyltransferase, mitochondrial, partial [Asbolus verrucosus]